MLSSQYNQTWSNSSYGKMTKNNIFIKHPSSFNIIQRAIFILSFIVLFWILFIIIYLSSRFIIRLVSNLKRSYFKSSSSSNIKICQTFVISSNQYGSFRPIQSLNRSDSLFSNSNFTLINQKQIITFSNNESIHLTINPHANIIETSAYQQSKTSLLEHYLQTYNPLQIDLTNTNQEITSVSNNKNISYEEPTTTSETDTQLVDNCYPLHCTNKQTRRYTRLKEQENCSATISLADDRLSECSTKLTTITLPIVMITDCSDSQRLHTNIIEMDEEE